jgi:hypothetical protein
LIPFEIYRHAEKRYEFLKTAGNVRKTLEDKEKFFDALLSTDNPEVRRVE